MLNITLKKFLTIPLLILGFTTIYGFDIGKPVESLDKISYIHFVSDNLASAGMLELDDYQFIKEYGFKHVINLIPGVQLAEKRHVQSLGLSYEQIAVDWGTPTLEDFQTFVSLMKSYADDKVFVRCQMNWRASTFVYLYRVTQLGMSKEAAKKDLEAVWTPEEQWQTFVETTLAHYSK